MSLCFFLKILGDLSLYCCAMNAMLSLALTKVDAIPPLIILAVIAALGYWLDDKQPDKRYFLLPLLFSVFFFGSGFSYNLTVGLGALYVGLCIFGQRYYMDYDDLARILKIGMAGTVFVTATFVMVLGLSHIIPFALLFVVSYLFLLQLLRQDPEILKEAKFRMINLLGITIILLITLFLTTDPFFSWFKSAALATYEFILPPVLYLLTWMGSVIFNIITGFFGLFPEPDDIGWKPNELFTKEKVHPEDMELIEEMTKPGLLMILQGCLILVGVICLVIWFLKSRKGRKKQMNSSIHELRTYIRDDRPEEKVYADYFPPREPREAVRYYYRNFLRLCVDLGHKIPRHFNSRLVQDEVSACFREGPLDELRQTYIRARYSEAEISKEDVKQMKQKLKKLKKSVPSSTHRTR